MAEPSAPQPDVEDDVLAFTPVPLQRVQANGWTPRRQRDFIQSLSVIGNVHRAAKAVGMTKQSAYGLRSRAGAESFAAAWDVALEIGYDRHYEVAIQRARYGIEVPCFYKGKQVGTRRRFDYRLAITVLDANPAPARASPRKKVAR